MRTLSLSMIGSLQSYIFSLSKRDGCSSRLTGLQHDCRSHEAEPAAFDERTASGDKPVRHAEIGPSVAGTVQYRQLAFEQNRFGDNETHTSGLNELNDGSNEVHQETDKSRILHGSERQTRADFGLTNLT